MNRSEMNRVIEGMHRLAKEDEQLLKHHGAINFIRLGEQPKKGVYNLFDFSSPSAVISEIERANAWDIFCADKRGSFENRNKLHTPLAGGAAQVKRYRSEIIAKFGRVVYEINPDATQEYGGHTGKCAKVENDQLIKWIAFVSKHFPPMESWAMLSLIGETRDRAVTYGVPKAKTQVGLMSFRH